MENEGWTTSNLGQISCSSSYGKEPKKKTARQPCTNPPCCPISVSSGAHRSSRKTDAISWHMRIAAEPPGSPTPAVQTFGQFLYLFRRFYSNFMPLYLPTLCQPIPRSLRSRFEPLAISDHLHVQPTFGKNILQKKKRDARTQSTVYYD